MNYRIKMRPFLLFNLFIASHSFSVSKSQGISESPMVIGGTGGSFDFMTVDETNRRLLAAHRGAGTLEIIDLKTRKALPAVSVGAAQGVAVDIEGHQYFLGNEADHHIVFVDSRSLSKTAEIKADGPVDAIAFDAKNRKLYAAHDDGDKLWVIDVDSKKIMGTVSKNCDSWKIDGKWGGL